MSRIQSYSPDLEQLKEIPGYQPILKSVLKSQIQFLVEQLSEQTGEESMLLTASITDGTLTHIGSSCGKVFLQDNEELKSKFLVFCMKQQTKRKPEILQTTEESTTPAKRQRQNDSHHSYPVSLHKIVPKGVKTSTFQPFRTEIVSCDTNEVDRTANTCTREDNRAATENIQSSDFVVKENIGYSDQSEQSEQGDRSDNQCVELGDSEQSIVIKQEPIDSETVISSPQYTPDQPGSSWRSGADTGPIDTISRSDRDRPSTSITEQIGDGAMAGVSRKTSSIEQFGDLSQTSINNKNATEKGGHMQDYIDALLMEGESEETVGKRPKSSSMSIQSFDEEDSDSETEVKITEHKGKFVTYEEFNKLVTTVQNLKKRVRQLEGPPIDPDDRSARCLDKLIEFCSTEIEAVESLALHIFGKEALIECSVTGKRPNTKTPPRDPLDKGKLMRLKKAVKRRFPDISNSMVTEKIQSIQRKLRKKAAESNK